MANIIGKAKGRAKTYMLTTQKLTPPMLHIDMHKHVTVVRDVGKFFPNQHKPKR